MINLWIEEQRHKNLKRKRKNWALLAILMFLIGMVIGKTCWADPWDGSCTSSQMIMIYMTK
jgi:hypothetical protein